MYRLTACTVIAAAILTPADAIADTPEIIQPLQLGAEAVRFDRGDYVVDLPGQHAVMQVRPMAADHGNISFVVVVLNTGSEPINVDTANFRIEGAPEPVRLLSRGEMVQKVEHRAGWAKFFTRLGGAMQAAGYANERNEAVASVSTPYWTATATASAPCGSCQFAALAVEAQTARQVADIQGALDTARSALGEQMFQLTTLYPGQSYAGRIFLTKFKHSSMTPIRLVAGVAGDTFAFGFRFAPEGTPAPAYHMTEAVAGSPSTHAVRPAMAALALHPGFMSPRTAATQPTVYVLPTSATPASRKNVASVPVNPQSRGYYNALIANGVSRDQARDMTEEQFGSAP